MAWVTPVVEFSPTTNPLETPVWVDITDDLRDQVSWGYGRSSEFDQANPGQASFILDNRDRKYDPHNTAGPYYGNLLPRRRVRISANGTVVFTGFVTGWRQSADWVSSDAIVEVSAIDPLTVLAQAIMPEEPYYYQVRATGASAYYRLTDPTEGIVRDQIGNAHGIPRGVKVEDNLGGDPWDIGTYFKDGGLGYIELPTSPYGSHTGASSVELWFKVKTLNPTNNTVAFGIRATDNWLWAVINDTGRIHEAVRVDDGLWHHWVIATSPGVGNNRHYVDGRLVWEGGVGIAIAQSFPGYQFHSIGWPSVALTASFDGWLRDVAFYPKELTAAEVTANYQAVKGYPLEQSGVRVSRILDIIGWPTADRIIDAGYSPVAAQGSEPLGDALGYLQEVCQAEGGLIFAQPDGKIRYRARHYANDDAASKTVQATYDDAPGSTLKYLTVAPAFDDQFIINDVTASGYDGTPVTLQDADSIKKYLRRATDLTGLKTSTPEAYARAEGIIRRYANPDPTNARLDEVVIDARQSSAQLSDAIARRVGDRVQVKWKENATGAQVTYTGHIEAYSHEVDVSELTWRFKFLTQPNDLEAYFIVGTNTVGSAAILGH